MKQNLNSDDYIVVEFTSEKGKTYEVGYPKAAGYTEETLEAELANFNAESALGSGGYQEIKYVPDGSSYTSEGAAKTGVPCGFVWYEKHPVKYHYQVKFINTRGWYFTFKDESGDTYRCSTLRNGVHHINYNSNEPTMIGVK